MDLPKAASIWWRVALQRRAAVLAILYKHNSSIKCVLTTRSGQISYAGDAAFPGGKADFEDETSLQVARREAFEEIGLNQDLPLEPMFTLPAYLSSKYHCVVPEVVWLEDARLNSVTLLPDVIEHNVSTEVHRIFPVKLERFLSPPNHSRSIDWDGLKFRANFFKVLAREKRIGEPSHVAVWGLTANILVDIARLVYKREPEFDYRKPGQIGDQQLIEALAAKGYFDGERPQHIDFCSVLDPALLASRQG